MLERRALFNDLCYGYDDLTRWESGKKTETVAELCFRKSTGSISHFTCFSSTFTWSKEFLIQNSFSDKAGTTQASLAAWIQLCPCNSKRLVWKLYYSKSLNPAQLKKSNFPSPPAGDHQTTPNVTTSTLAKFRKSIHLKMFRDNRVLFCLSVNWI